MSTVNHARPLAVVILAAGKGTSVVLETDGDQEQEAQTAILALMDDKFGEGE